MPAIETTGLTEQYGGVTAVADLDLAVEVDRVPEGPCSVGGVAGASVTDTTVIVQCGDEAKTGVLTVLDEAGASVRDFELTEISLEEPFMTYTTDHPSSTGDTHLDDSPTTTDTSATVGGRQ
ncbi:hypothetical protein [Halocatena salina]|uniref:Uncharacterized protein n=1 Tax=Halocatena salina TaxID=2934340 RepID=A0A8U0A7J9_9EURY|nr:hypothetical protein [Halocatena salina]UPM44819.1 hypothetical protein MW046_15630 [Halocatena salina]